MKKKICILFSFLCGALSSYSQSGCDNSRYFNTIFDNAAVTYNVQYGHNTTIGGNPIDLKMDIYESANDTLRKRPLVIFAHGGRFISGNRTQMGYICEDFAQRGYVAATISYRLIDAFIPDSLIKTEIVMAIHDMKAAIRFFREDAATANTYRIDPDLIFAGGISAGASMADGVGYIDTLDNILPEWVTVINANGGFEGNSSNNTQYSSAVQGVLNFSGGIADVNLIDSDDPPLYSFHDEFDGTVACRYNTAISPLHGSCDMHDRANAVGIVNQFYLRAESNQHVGFSYGTILYESSRFLGQIICGSAPQQPWLELGSGLDKPGFAAFDISVVDTNIIWAISFNGHEFSKTTDGGQNWTTQALSFSDTTFGVFGIQAFSDSLAYLLALEFPKQTTGKMYKTIDGGANWKEQSSSFVNPYEGPQVFHFFNENEGFALVWHINPNNSSLTSHLGYITSNGGDTWTLLSATDYPSSPGEDLIIEDTKFLASRRDHLWFGTSTGKVFHSADKGHTWSVHTVSPLVAIQSLAFKDELNGIAVTGNASNGNDIIAAFSTSDGGVTWNVLPVPPLPRTTGIYFIEGSSGPSHPCGTYVIFNGNYSICGSAYSDDDGLTWNLMSQQPVFDIEFLDPEHGWMGGMIHGAQKGGVYKWNGQSLTSNPGCISGIKEQHADVEYFSVYPNPSSGLTNIYVTNNSLGKVKLNVMNSYGQMVYTCELQKNNRSETYALDMTKLNAGLYQVIIMDDEKRTARSVIKF